jgi:phage-related protein
MKSVIFLGDSLERLRGFPEQARRSCGYQLDRVQRGLDPDDWKPMSTIGAGVREIRVRDASGAFRILYVAQFEGAVYVLHAFQKMTPRTSVRDIALGQARLVELRRDLQR